MIKHSNRRIKNHLLRLCSKVIKPSDEPPPNLRDSAIQVICKSGDPSSSTNYRPICSIPILYKLFSQLVFRIRLLHYGPLVHIPAVQTESRRMAPDTFGSQPLTLRRHSTQLSTAAYGGPCVNKALSKRAHGRHTQPSPPQRRIQAWRPTLYDLVQLTSTTHHETTH